MPEERGDAFVGSPAHAGIDPHMIMAAACHYDGSPAHAGIDLFQQLAVDSSSFAGSPAHAGIDRIARCSFRVREGPGFPRPRGDRPRRVHDWKWRRYAQGSPAHAGIDRSVDEVPVSSLTRFPRPRGDRPAVSWLIPTVACCRFPRPRGDCSTEALYSWRHRFPRPRGDRPHGGAMAVKLRARQVPPPTRG